MLFILIVCIFIANAKMIRLHFCAVYYFDSVSEENAGLANLNERVFDLTFHVFESTEDGAVQPTSKPDECL